MRLGDRSVLVALIVGLLASAGCKPPQTPIVWVDLDQVPIAVAPPPPPTVGLAPTAPIMSEDTVEALPAASLYMGAERTKLEQVTEIREGNERKAFDDIYRRLREVSFAEAKRDADAAVAALRPGYEERLDRVYDEARSIFLTYAEPAGAFRLQLTQIVGFPDPDPLSRKLPDSMDETAMRRFNSAKDLRETLATLSDMFWSEFGESVDAVESEYLRERAAIQRGMVERQEELDAAARARAKEIVEGAKNGGLATPLDLQAALPGEAGSGARVEGSVVVPNLPAERPLDWQEAQRAELEAELRIWIATNRYRLAERPGGARDATQEFIVWRKGLRAGL